MSHVESKKSPLSCWYYFSHVDRPHGVVDFKKRPCRPVELTGQEPPNKAHLLRWSPVQAVPDPCMHTVHTERHATRAYLGTTPHLGDAQTSIKFTKR